MKQLINPDAFCLSVERALKTSFNKKEAIRRLNKRLTSTPDGTLYIRHDRNYITFYRGSDNGVSYLNKTGEMLYDLARKRYLLLLKKIIETMDKSGFSETAPYQQELTKLILDFARGNLDIARIVLTKKQYKWYTGKFIQKPVDPKLPNRTINGIITHSKSERDIGSGLECVAVPYHYEERTIVNVLPFVQYLESRLADSGELEGNLFYYRNNICIWRVPKRLEWMNQVGSVWRTYNYKTGCIYMHNDFRILLADDEFMIWEHEGLFEDFTYRSNATERIAILEYMNVLPRRNILRTFERDVANRELVDKFIQENILPRLWF